jgi:YfiH family protein
MRQGALTKRLPYSFLYWKEVFVDLVQVPGWERYSWLRHGFSTRTGGVSTVYKGSSLNLGWTKEDDPALVAENRRRLLLAVIGPNIAQGQRALTLRQVHSTLIHVARQEDGPYETEEGRAILEGDGLMTALPGVPLGIQTADCVPVMVIDSEQRIVAVVHAGWRGTVAGIAAAAMTKMVEEFGSRPADLIAAVGPSIGPCCYTVGDEVRKAFRERYPYAEQLFLQDRLDLWEANRLQLLNAGVGEKNIAVVGECTGFALTASGERKYFSHRIDQGITGRMMSVVSIAGND